MSSGVNMDDSVKLLLDREVKKNHTLCNDQTDNAIILPLYDFCVKVPTSVLLYKNFSLLCLPGNGPVSFLYNSVPGHSVLL